MIVTEIYNGQGLGNQLWCYVTTRVIAKDKGYDFGIKSPEKFKCNDFLSLDFGKKVIGGAGPEGGPPESLPKGIHYYYKEKRIDHPLNGIDIRMYDQNLVSIPDHTKIDGVMQDEKYILHRKKEIKSWLKVKEEYECLDYASDDICVINFRGGEYVHIKNVFLPQSYWDAAVRHMREINPNFRFVVITDDVKIAKKFFPKFEVHHFSIAKDYVVIKNAHYLILSNSSFACFPAWLNENLKLCIAPKYWSQYNTSDGYWGCSYNMIKGWQYLGRDGKLNTYEQCQKEFESYVKKHPDYFAPKKLQNSFLVISSYKNDLSWVPEYTDHYLIYDKSEEKIFPHTLNPKKVINHPNVGYNLYDYFTFIIDHYDKLPECVFFTKGNVVPRHVSQNYFDSVMNSTEFTPIEEKNRLQTRWRISHFDKGGGYNELNNSWYLNHLATKYFHSYTDFLTYCFKDPIIPRFIRFAPGANYIVPKECILKYPKIFYENLRHFVSYTQLPGEAHILERALYTLWTANFEPSEAMLKPFNEKNFVPVPRRRTKLGTLKHHLIKRFKKQAAPAQEIAAYRKSIKIYDAFIFFNELELLEIRLNVLKDVVDYFVIVESTKTFSGLPKKLFYQENKARFAQFKDQIIHFVVDDLPNSEEELQKRLQNKKLSAIDREIIEYCLTTDNVPKGQPHWLREFYQKESVKKALGNLHDNDICFISDIDEIWNPELAIDYRKDDIFKLRQYVYTYFLNNRSSEPWAGTYVTKYKNIKHNSLNHLDTPSKTKYTYLKNGGWHFTNQGGADRIRTKLESYGHQEFNNEDIKADLENKILKNKDFIGRRFKFRVDEKNLPDYLKKSREKYRNLFR